MRQVVLILLLLVFVAGCSSNPPTAPRAAPPPRRPRPCSAPTSSCADLNGLPQSRRTGFARRPDPERRDPARAVLHRGRVEACAFESGHAAVRGSQAQPILARRAPGHLAEFTRVTGNASVKCIESGTHWSSI